MLEMQLRLWTWLVSQTALVRERLKTARNDDGEVTSTTALIVLLVVAAIAAGGVITAKIAGNANHVPTP
jgi:hypothetical protein